MKPDASRLNLEAALAAANAQITALKECRAQLEHKIEQRDAELERAQERLAEFTQAVADAQSARDRLFNALHLEIRAPLALIALAVSDLKNRATDNAPFLGLEDSVRRLLTLVDGLLLMASGQTPSAASEPSPHETPSQLESRALPTLLLVDDDATFCDAMARLLGKHYRVFTAHDGVTALHLAREHHPHMLICDVDMPGMDGITLSRRFRALPGNRLTPTLLLTAHRDVRARMASSDASDTLLKPVEPELLFARVRTQLALRSLMARLNDAEKLAELGTLSAGLAHELRNPANAVVNAIEPLMEMLPKALTQPETPTGELLGVIRDGAEQLRALAQQLLGFVRPGELVAQNESLEGLVLRALSMVSNTMRGITVRKNMLYTGLVPCAGPLLVQVLTNVLENAAQAASRGGWVQIDTWQDADHVCVDIADSGAGVPVELRERIFEPFFTTKSPGSGTGLGLSTARAILQRHRGSLSVVDRPEGAAFRITLPLQSSTATHAWPHPSAPSARRLSS